MTDSGRGTTRVPRSPAHVRLGSELRRLRKGAGASTRSIGPYSSGHISNVESGCTTPSVNLVERYIAMFGDGPTIRALFQQVQHVAAERRRRQFTKDEQPGQPLAPTDLTAVSTPDDVIRHYVVETHEARYALGPTGAIETLAVNALLRAISPQVRLYYAGHFYDADQRPGVLRVVAGQGLSPLAQQESENGAVRSYFLLDRPLDPGDDEPYPVSYAVEVRSRERALPLLAFYSKPGTIRLDLLARFARPAVPRRLWWFAAPNVVSIDQLPERELRPTGDDTYARQFDRLVPSWCYGFSWLW